MSTLTQTIKTIARTFNEFTLRGGGIQMRPYQLEPAKAIFTSIVKNQGLTIVIIMSRQAGKDELLANFIAFILNLFAHRESGIVYVNPTYKPQTINAITRLENRLKANLLTKAFWRKRSDFMRMIGLCTVSFLSGDKSANVVGATASKLLIVNEAQDITPEKYDKDIAPMAASTNATRVIVGTVWTSRTLLAREMRAAKEAEKADGIKRVFIYPADVVGKIVPPYARFVQGEVKKLGRNHPIIKTQFYCEEIDAQTGMFNAARRALMTGDQPSQSEPTPGHIYVFCIDIAGQDEAAMGTGDETTQLNNPGRDSVTLTIHDVDLSTLELLQAPTYRVVHREAWQGQNHLIIFGKLKNYADLWNPLYQVIDATGVGEGLWAMLDRTYPHRILPFKFTSTSKSELGYQYIGIIETGRFRDCAPSSEIDEQYSRCIAEVLIGPAKTMRWGVPAGTRDADGQLVHDDFIISDALISIVDKLDWYIPSETKVIESTDPLQEMDNAY